MVVVGQHSHCLGKTRSGPTRAQHELAVATWANVRCADRYVHRMTGLRVCPEDQRVCLGKQPGCRSEGPCGLSAGVAGKEPPRMGVQNVQRYSHHNITPVGQTPAVQPIAVGKTSYIIHHLRQQEMLEKQGSSKVVALPTLRRNSLVQNNFYTGRKSSGPSKTGDIIVATRLLPKASPTVQTKNVATPVRDTRFHRRVDAQT